MSVPGTLYLPDPFLSRRRVKDYTAQIQSIGHTDL